MTGDAQTEVNKVIGKYDTASQLSTVPTLPQIAALRRIFLLFVVNELQISAVVWNKEQLQQLGQTVRLSGCQCLRKNYKAKGYKAYHITILSVTDAQFLRPLLFSSLSNRCKAE